MGVQNNRFSRFKPHGRKPVGIYVMGGYYERKDCHSNGIVPCETFQLRNLEGVHFPKLYTALPQGNGTE